MEDQLHYCTTAAQLIAENRTKETKKEQNED